MAFFGLGTFPAMLVTIVMGIYLNQQVRLKISRALPVLLFIMGALLIFRGLELGVPFLSPVFTGVRDAAISCG